MGSSIDQIIPKCRKSDKIISLRIDRIKKHFLKCPGPVIIYMDVKCMEDHDKIGVDKTLKDFKKGEPKNLMPSKPDFTEEREALPQTWTSDAEAEWRRENDLKYLPNVIDYEKYPHKRYRSESQESDETPAYKRANMSLDNNRKRGRS